MIPKKTRVRNALVNFGHPPLGILAVRQNSNDRSPARVRSPARPIETFPYPVARPTYNTRVKENKIGLFARGRRAGFSCDALAFGGGGKFFGKIKLVVNQNIHPDACDSGISK